MKEIKLAINFSPAISSRSCYAYPLMLLHGGHDAEKSFIAHAYVNCYYDTSYFDIYEQDYHFQNLGAFDREEECVTTYDLRNKQELSLEYFYRRLSEGYAITGHWNQSLIKNESGLEDEEYLMYGINLDEKTLLFVSINNDIPTSYVVPAELFFAAIMSVTEDLYWFTYIRFNKVNDTPIDIETIVLDYLDFIGSRTRKNLFDDGRTYGISYFDSYIARINYCIKNGEKLNVSDAFVMLDHKIATKIRIEYLIEKNILNKSNLEDYQLVYLIFKHHINDVIEFNEKLSAKKGKEIIEKMKFAKEKELIHAMNFIRTINLRG